MLTFDQKAQRISVSAEHLNRFQLEGNAFLQRRVICGKHFTPESKKPSMEWRYKGSPPKKFKRQQSAGKIMESVFWDSERVIHVDFLPPRATVNDEYYSNLPLNYVHAAIRKKIPGKLSKGIILLHNACPHLFRPMKKYLEGQKFKTDDNSSAVS
jgi:hypothetical protein